MNEKSKKHLNFFEKIYKLTSPLSRKEAQNYITAVKERGIKQEKTDKAKEDLGEERVN